MREQISAGSRQSRDDGVAVVVLHLQEHAIAGFRLAFAARPWRAAGDAREYVADDQPLAALRIAAEQAELAEREAAAPPPIERLHLHLIGADDLQFFRHRRCFRRHPPSSDSGSSQHCPLDAANDFIDLARRQPGEARDVGERRRARRRFEPAVADQSRRYDWRTKKSAIAFRPVCAWASLRRMPANIASADGALSAK